MYKTLTTLLDRLDSPALVGTNVIQWGSPVPSFGDLTISRVATLGLNPSNREFVDEAGDELQGASRRFHTLNSLGLQSWSNADIRHLRLILTSCRLYFHGNPYDRWFRRLDQVVLGTGSSYYSDTKRACHLDLIPYATERKWTDLTLDQRMSLIRVTEDALGILLRDSPVRILILNGNTVVKHFQESAGICLEKEEMQGWSLPRRSGFNVKGYAFKGFVSRLKGIDLGRDILVLGYNHNLQGSFGVTNAVIEEIRDWITRVTRDLVS